MIYAEINVANMRVNKST